MIIFRIIGSILLIGLFAWMVISLSSYDGWRNTPEVVGLGKAFEGTVQLPRDEIERRWSTARQRMVEINEDGRWYSVVGDGSSWLTFACTAAITLIVGFYGRAPASVGVGAPPNLAGLPLGTTRIVGFLAALGAVLTAGSSLATNRGHEYYARADEAQALINQAVKAVHDATTEVEARDALDYMELKIARL